LYRGSAVGWAGFIKPNIGDCIEADVGQTVRLFTYGVTLWPRKKVNAATGLPIEPQVLETPRWC
jgi:hypothetical protein